MARLCLNLCFREGSKQKYINKEWSMRKGHEHHSIRSVLCFKYRCNWETNGIYFHVLDKILMDSKTRLRIEFSKKFCKTFLFISNTQLSIVFKFVSQVPSSPLQIPPGQTSNHPSSCLHHTRLIEQQNNSSKGE